MKTFAAFLRRPRERLQALAGTAEQLTLVFDAGASSQNNLDSLEPGPDSYVTSVPPLPPAPCGRKEPSTGRK